jgi:hypothetical protein
MREAVQLGSRSMTAVTALLPKAHDRAGQDLLDVTA